MRCPHCAAEQPLGVTVCGFCGAVMVQGVPSLRGGEAEAIWRGAAQVSRTARRARRWVGLGALATGLGLGIGWIVARAGVDRVAEPGPAEAETAAVDLPAGQGAPEAAPPPTDSSVSRGRGRVRLTEESLLEFTDELARLAGEGNSRELASLVDPRVRYRLRLDDGREVRELRGGKPELLAHWLAPWLVWELLGSTVEETIETERATVDTDSRRGVVVRRVETVGDVSRLRFPPALLGPLAVRGALDRERAEEVDYSPLTRSDVLCQATETVHVAAGPAGARVVEVERSGRCRPWP